MSKFHDYETSQEDYWRIDRWDPLAERFSLRESQVSEWHDFMAGQGRAWEIIRSIYGISPLLEFEGFQKREKKQLAKDLGVSQAVIDRELENAAESWRLSQARGQVSNQLKERESDIEALTHFSHADGLDEDAVDELLKAFDFNSIRDPDHRVQVAGRILTLSEHLRAPNTRTPAREVIRMEVTMHGLQKIQVSKQAQIDEWLDDPEKSRIKAGELDKFQESVNSLDDRIRKIAKDHAILLEKIGADELDQTARKKAFAGDVAYLIESCRAFESDPENVKVDGIWTASEIDWQLDPLAEGRDPQYRPDIAIRMADALRPENLWDPEYRPPKVAKRICQELRQMVHHLRGVPEDAEELPEDPDYDDEPDDEAPEAIEGDSGKERRLENLRPAVARDEASSSEGTMGVF